ncbi:MAG TPA: XrtA system polysaccharide deacetylase [Gemmatimonadales bacterium]|nr:XrtA system polysaccharide deacetylase [Gemmatimonadales bacterium]
MNPDAAAAHVFSVDVEEYFQVLAFERAVPRRAWESLPSRVEASVDTLLELLARHGASATFFTVGWVAERKPALIRRIAAAGHGIAAHSWWHRRVTSLAPGEFLEDVRRCRTVLEDIAGVPVVGFRAPSFSIVPGAEWAFDALIEAGYRYDSSIFPIRRPGYGYPGAPTEAYRVQRPAGSLLELPMATTLFGPVRVPAAGGGYFRQLPYALTARALEEHSSAGKSAMFYIHPWEIDPGQPRLAVSPLTRLRHYNGLGRTLGRLERLLGQFRFTSAERRYALG